MANASKIFDQRVLKLAYLDAEQRHVDARKLYLESKLKSLADIQLTMIPSVDALASARYDLVIVSASHIPGEDFEKWLDTFCIRMKAHVWIPALILATLEARQLESLLKKIVHQNWYFDIVDPQHMDSMPIRVANLIRIHDHLQELQRYDDELTVLTQRLAEIEGQLGDEHPQT